MATTRLFPARAPGDHSSSQSRTISIDHGSGCAQLSFPTVGEMTMTAPVRPPISRREMLSKVPQVTAAFWLIKVLCTTVGETCADLLNDKLGLGLTMTTYIMGIFLAVMLIAQFTLRRYVPAAYWSVVVLLSVVGTLITDNLTDNFGVALTTTTTIFAVALAIVFAVWYAVERTLSIHSIVTIRREVFYWLAILFTFALGTAAGDLVSEKLSLGYLVATALFAALIGLFALAWRMKVNAVFVFWGAYILTRPLGASIGDLLGQHRADGGLGLGQLKISVVFLLTITALVGYVTRTRVDVLDEAGQVDEPSVPADYASASWAVDVH
jgi:uncharacterized membrane-anchored protein